MPAVPFCLLEPLLDQFVALLPVRERDSAGHPLGCRRRRVSDPEHAVPALVHGSGYERIASPGCPDRTIRPRVNRWADLGTEHMVHALVPEAYDRMTGIGLDEIPVGGCITKAP